MARCASLAFTASQSGRKIAVSNHTAKRRIRLPKRGFCQTGRSTPRPVSNAVVAHRNTPRLTNSAGYVIMEMLQVQREHRIASPVLFHAEMLYVRCEHSRALRAYSQSGNAVCFGQNTVCQPPELHGSFQKTRLSLGSWELLFENLRILTVLGGFAMKQCMDADNLHRRLKKIIGQVQAIDRMVDEAVSYTHLRAHET